MGNSGSAPAPAPAPSPEDEAKAKQAGIIIGIIIGVVVLIAIIIVIFKFSPPLEVIKQAAIGATKGVSTSSTGRVSQLPWGTIIPVFLGLMAIYYFSIGLWYKYTKGKYRANPLSYNGLISIQQAVISTALGSTYPSASGTPSNGSSVCKALIEKYPSVFGTIVAPTTSNIGDARALLNWRPLTVRLPGYLNGQNGPADGVFSQPFGVDAALTLGARGFFFDIDYEDASPCVPFIIFRDDSGIKRSLNNGNIKDAMTELASKAFNTNYDPVLVIIYLRRVPPGAQQQSNFFGAIANALNPLAQYHLGQTDKGNFHNCRSESILFTSPITDYQKKFIILTNYDTSKLPSRKNPVDNLDYWTNARIYQDPSGISPSLGSVLVTAPPAPTAVAFVGHIDHLLNIGTKDQPAYQAQSSGKFCIAIGSPDFAYSPAQIALLMNTLGIQCVPLDLIGLGISANHIATMKLAQTPATNFTSLAKLDNMYNLTNEKDILSFWTYTGWSMKMINSGTTVGPTAAPTAAPATAAPPTTKKESFQDYKDYKEGFEEAAPVPPATPIPGFIIPKPVAPKQPSAKMNSNGGLVSIK